MNTSEEMLIAIKDSVKEGTQFHKLTEEWSEYLAKVFEDKINIETITKEVSE